MKSRESEGNLVVSVLVDTSNKNTYKYVEPAIYSALNHFGIPYRIIDLAKKSLPKNKILDSRGIIIAQENIGRKIFPELANIILRAMNFGSGLVNFDPDLNKFPSEFKKLLGESFSTLVCDEIRIKNNNHFITSSKEKNDKKTLLKSVNLCKISGLVPSIRILLEDEKKNPVLLVRRIKQAKIVQFTVSPKIWLRDYFGHAEGLDDIFWKSIIWTVKKPFLMKAMPPFVTMRVDDCYGWEDYKWIDIANKYGYIPNAGIFTNRIEQKIVPKMKKLFKPGLTEFSPHAYSDDPDKWLIYLKHNAQEYPEEILRTRFSGLDKQFKSWGIRMSRVLNPHFEEVGKNAMPFLYKRKVLYRMMTYLPGELWWGIHKDWKPAPYGNYGYAFDYLPGYPGFMVVSAGMISWRLMRKIMPDKYIYKPDLNMLFYDDFLWKATTINSKINLETAIEVGTKQLKLGLDNKFFGLLNTHEHRMEGYMSLKQWDFILKEIEKRTSKYDKIYKGYDYIAEYARCKLETDIRKIDYNNKKKIITCQLTGKSTLPLIFYLFNEKNREIRCQFKKIPSFSKKITASIQT